MKFRSIALGSLLTAAFLMISGADCPGRSPLAQGIDGGTTPPTLNWNLIGGGNRTLAQGQQFSISNEIVITGSYAGDRSTYDLSFSGIPSTWGPELSVSSITCPPGQGQGSPVKSSSGCVFTLTGMTPASVASGEFPYTVRAQRRGTNEAQTVTGVLTIPQLGGSLNLEQFSIPERDMTDVTIGQFGDDTARWQMSVIAPSDFNGIVDVSVAFQDSRINSSPFTRVLAPTSLDFGNVSTSPLSGLDEKRREFTLTVRRSQNIGFRGTFPFNITLNTRGTNQSQTFLLTGDNALRISETPLGN
jgi:hypothetical protein